VPGRIFWFLTLGDVAKTWVCSALQSPRAYLKGQRTLYGDQAICCRADDFWSIKDLMKTFLYWKMLISVNGCMDSTWQVELPAGLR